MFTLIYISSPFTDVHIFFRGYSDTWRLNNLWGTAFSYCITCAHWFDLCVTCIHVKSGKTVTLSQLVGMIYAHFHRVQYPNTAISSAQGPTYPSLSTSLNSFQLGQFTSGPCHHESAPDVLLELDSVAYDTENPPSSKCQENPSAPPHPNPSPFVSLCE